MELNVKTDLPVEESSQRQPAKRASKEAVGQWVRKIDAAIGKYRKGVFEVGDLLSEARGELSDSAFRNVVRSTGIGAEKTADNYIRVAKSKLLRREDILPHLPVTVGPLIDLAAWKEDELLQAIAEKKLTPVATRKQLDHWHTARNSPGPDQQAQIMQAKPERTAITVGYIIAEYDANAFNDISPESQSDLISLINRVNAMRLDDRFIFSLHQAEDFDRTKEDVLMARLDAFRNSPQFRENFSAMEIIFGGEDGSIDIDSLRLSWVPKLTDPTNNAIRQLIPLSEADVEFLSRQYRERVARRAEIRGGSKPVEAVPEHSDAPEPALAHEPTG